MSKYKVRTSDGHRNQFTSLKQLWRRHYFSSLLSLNEMKYKANIRIVWSPLINMTVSVRDYEAPWQLIHGHSEIELHELIPALRTELV